MGNFRAAAPYAILGWGLGLWTFWYILQNGFTIAELPDLPWYEYIVPLLLSNLMVLRSWALMFNTEQPNGENT
jgi:hypothetical protein